MTKRNGFLYINMAALCVRQIGAALVADDITTADIYGGSSYASNKTKGRRRARLHYTQLVRNTAKTPLSRGHMHASVGVRRSHLQPIARSTSRVADAPNGRLVRPIIREEIEHGKIS